MQLRTNEDLHAMPKEHLVALVQELQGLARVQAQAIEEIADERDAALLLNELCHY